MNYLTTDIEGVYILEPKVFEDARGYFFESWKKEDFEKHIGKVDFIQDNESKSSYGVLRGLHYQKGEFSQAKLVRVIKGRVLDVAVDLRKDSATFGKHVMVELSDEAIFTYKVDNVYAPQAEASIRWNDPDLNIEWPIKKEDVLTSEKDLLKAKAFKDADTF